jgi:hypothetical protein
MDTPQKWATPACPQAQLKHEFEAEGHQAEYDAGYANEVHAADPVHIDTFFENGRVVTVTR